VIKIAEALQHLAQQTKTTHISEARHQDIRLLQIMLRYHKRKTLPTNVGTLLITQLNGSDQALI